MLQEKLRLGFGCMRLPMKDGQVDLLEFQHMVDAYMKAGGRYFDTAHSYLEGRSETALRVCLAERYPREAFLLTNKLTRTFIEKPEDVLPLFEKQLRACGVEYFDYYLFHAVRRNNYYDKFLRCDAFRQAEQLKAEGKIRHLGMSFHDDPEFLDQVLCAHPEIEVVQLQFNYLDLHNPDVESLGCYEVCCKHGKQVLVMEPVKGGRLAELPPEAARILEALKGGSSASYAIRFAASYPQVAMVLSGMSNEAQMADNLRTMGSFAPLNDREREAVEQVTELLRRQMLIACTACRYCTEVCPQGIPIPELFEAWNRRKALEPWKPVEARPGDCLDCGACEEACPQHLEIRRLLKKTETVLK